MPKYVIRSLYSTAEAEAWCRDVGYQEYLVIHKQISPEAVLLSEEGYKEFCILLDKELERNHAAGIA